MVHRQLGFTYGGRSLRVILYDGTMLTYIRAPEIFDVINMPIVALLDH